MREPPDDLAEEFGVWEQEETEWVRLSDLLAAEWVGQVRSWDEVDFEFTDAD